MDRCRTDAGIRGRPPRSGAATRAHRAWGSSFLAVAGTATRRGGLVRARPVSWHEDRGRGGAGLGEAQRQSWMGGRPSVSHSRSSRAVSSSSAGSPATWTLPSIWIQTMPRSGSWRTHMPSVGSMPSSAWRFTSAGMVWSTAGCCRPRGPAASMKSAHMADGSVWRSLDPAAPQLLTNAHVVAVLAGWPLVAEHLGQLLGVISDDRHQLQPRGMGGARRSGPDAGRSPVASPMQILVSVSSLHAHCRSAASGRDGRVDRRRPAPGRGPGAIGPAGRGPRPGGAHGQGT